VTAAEDALFKMPLPAWSLLIRGPVIQSAAIPIMEADLQRVVRRYAGFLVFFFVTVIALWLFGAEIFSLMLQICRDGSSADV